MRFEIPECRRCIFCFPLRCGIFIFGYFNLLITILLLALEVWLGWTEPITATTRSLYRGITMFTQLWLCVVLYSLEILFNLILIAGAHTKRKMLILTYYYYGIATTAATFVTLVVIKFHDFYTGWGGYHALDIILESFGFVFHIYLLLLIRSELSKPRYQTGVTFVNQVAEVVTPSPWGDGRNPL